MPAIWREPELLKADLHIHTAYSMDCNTPLPQIIDRCLELGINCIAIADHGTIEGALKMQEMAPFPVIIAEEILTPHGEIMGMFLSKEIPSGTPVTETLSLIREQGGLVNIPHPYDTFRQSALDGPVLREIAGQIDLIEVFNARAVLKRDSTRARRFARKHSLPGSAGSDAHTPQEIGNAYVEMPEFNGKEEFLKALAAGKIYGQRTNPLIHFRSAWARVKNKF
jgi:predicted metal-dependent phosphoesterase TrpH